MIAHAFEHIHENWLRAKSLIRLALLKYADKGDWARFVVYRDSQRAGGVPPTHAWVLAYERFRPLIDKAIERAKADIVRAQGANGVRHDFIINRAKLRAKKRDAWKGVVTPYRRERLTGLEPAPMSEGQKMMAEGGQ